jgi:hypothetical protein
VQKKPKTGCSNKSRFQEVCIRNLKNFPSSPCEEGVSRVAWEQDNFGYSAKLEKTAPGCPFGILTEDKHSFCMFKFLAMTNEGLTYKEISKRIGLNTKQIEAIEKTALQKLKALSPVTELQNIHKEENLFNGNEDHSDLYFDYSDFNAETLMDLGDEEFIGK